MVGRKRQLSLGAWIVLVWGGANCAPPGLPPWPDSDTVGPATPSAFACSPPYARFANTTFRWADLDRGRSCEVFFEQDECVLGVFRDCSAGEEVREWRGFIDGDDRILLNALHDPAEGFGLPRRPRCCVGGLVRANGDSTWSMLGCRNFDCDNTNDFEHLGVLLEKGEPAPDGTEVGRIELPAPAVDADGNLALISNAGPDIDGVWDLSRSPVARRFALAAGRLVAEASDGAYVADAQGVIRDDGARWNLPEAPRALVALNPGVLVLTSSSVLAFRPDRVPGTARRRRFDFAATTPATLGRDGEGRPWVLTTGPDTLVRFDGELMVSATVELSRDFVEPPGARGVWHRGAFTTIARCHDAATQVSCVWSVQSDGTVWRTGLSDVVQLGRLASVDGHLWATDEGGFVHALLNHDESELTGRLRPSPGARFQLPSGVVLITGPDEEGRWRVFERAGQRVWTVEPAGGKG